MGDVFGDHGKCLSSSNIYFMNGIFINRIITPSATNSDESNGLLMEQVGIYNIEIKCLSLMPATAMNAC